MKILLAAIALLLACGCGATPSSSSTLVPLDAPALLALHGTDIDGRAVDLGALAGAGKPVAVIFWQTWCKSCLEEAPRLARDAKAYGDRIAFLGVVPGPDDAVDEDEVRRLATKFGLPYPEVRDRDLVWTKAFAITGTPTLLLLDAKGRTLYRGHRPPADWGALLAR